LAEYEIFRDDFNRAAGLVDQDWNDADSQYKTTGSGMYHDGNGSAHLVHQVDEHVDQIVEFKTNWGWTSGSGRSGTVLLRLSGPGGTTYYVLTFKYYLSSTADWLTIGRRTGGGTTTLASLTGSFDSTEFTLRFQAIGEDLAVYVDGVEKLTTTDGGIAHGEYVGLRNYINSHNTVDWFRVLTPNEPAAEDTLTVIPGTTIATGTSQYFLVSHQVGNWEVGTPGVPTLETDGAVIDRQTIFGPFSGVLVIQVPGTAGTIQLHDPLNGTYADILLLGPTDPPLTTEQILQQVLDFVVQIKTEMHGSVSADPDLMYKVQQIVDALNADPEQNGTTFIEDIYNILRAIWPIGTDPDADLGSNMAKMDSLTDVAAQTDTNVLSLVQSHELGIPAVLDAIAAFEPGGECDLTPVLDAVQDVADSVALVAADVTSLVGTEVPHIQLELDLIRQVASAALALALVPLIGETAATTIQLADLAADVASLFGDAVSIADLMSEVIPTGDDAPAYNVNGLAIKLQAIHNDVLALAAQQNMPRPWPGIGNVTLGTPQAFNGPTAITANMDGAIISITQVPTRTGGGADVPGRPYWWRIGWYAFIDDYGNIEQPRWLATNSLVAVPQSILRPAGIVVSCETGVVGAVTPWDSVA
jgi:hypothetical protein